MPAAYEEILAFLLAQLTPPVEQSVQDDGSIVITSGEPGEIVARLTTSDVAIAEFAVAWHDPHTPVVEPIAIATVRWEAISSEAAFRTLRALIAAAREARLAKFSSCEICERSTPPEEMYDDGICQSCAERERGVVH